MTNLDIFKRHFNNEYPNEKELIIDLNEHVTIHEHKWIKIIFKDKDSQELSLKSNPELFSFSNIIAKSIGYAGVIMGSMQAVLELYICGETETRWYEPGLYGTYGISGTSGVSGTSGSIGTTNYSGATHFTGITINPFQLDTEYIRTRDPVDITPRIHKDNKKWYHKLIPSRKR